MSDAFDSRSESAAVWWHAAFALAAVVCAVFLLLSGQADSRLGWALAGVAAPGLLGLGFRFGFTPLLRPALPIVWAVGATLAAVLTGGVVGPLAPLIVTPVLATLVLDRRRLAEGAALSLGALAVAALVQAAGATLTPAGAATLWLSLFALAALIGFGAAALIVSSRVQSAVTHQPQPASQPTAAEVPAGDPDDERRLRAALSAARARIQAVEIDAADAHAANRAKSRFLANMSHELRTPLNAVLGFSDTMRMRMFGPLPDRYAEYAGMIHESGRHLLDLINDLLDISKIEAERYVLELETFDVGEAAGAALRLMRLQAHDAGVALRSELPVRPLDVQADRRAVKQIVINLLSNALKFTPTGGSATLTVRAAEGQLEIVASDTGVGIATEDLERLGRPYEQAGDAASRAQGTGLGLSLVRALAALHGGSVEIESRLGEGTAVTVRLPVLIPAQVAPGPGPALPDMAPDNVIPFEARA